MTYSLYNLRGLPRLMSFPFKLSLVGWMTNHTLGKANANTLPENYICLGFNRKKYSPYLKEDYTQLSFLPVNTYVDGSSTPHDEVLFSYKPDVTEMLCNLFGSKKPVLLKGFPFNNMPPCILPTWTICITL